MSRPLLIRGLTALVGLCVLPLLPIYVERTMTRAILVGRGGERIDWGWKATSLRTFVDDYSYMRPEQSPLVFAFVNAVLLLVWVGLVVVAVDRAMARARR